MPFRAEKAGNRPKAAIKRTRRPNYTTPIFSMSDREQDFYRFLKNPPPLRGVEVRNEPQIRAAGSVDFLFQVSEPDRLCKVSVNLFRVSYRFCKPAGQSEFCVGKTGTSN